MQAIKRIARNLVLHVDVPLLIAISLLAAVGLIALFSASGGEGYNRLYSQIRNYGFALVALWVVSNIPPQQLMRLAIPIYGVGLLLLIAVAVIGDVRLGARRWLDLGVMSLQPSELMKIGIPLTLAWYFDRHEASLNIKDFFFAVVLLIIPVGLILRQPDLGTALLILSSGFYVLFLAGLSWKFILGLIIVGSASLPVAWRFLHDYQQRRILTLLDPTSDPLGAGYHIIQSTIAIGSGGLAGKGWLKGTQAHLDFLPERTTDFIFAVYGEEFGLIGNVILVFLYLLVIARGLVIAANAGNLFGRLMAGSITLTFFTYAFVNIGMVSGILPVVGVPLPIVSYGGTSLVTMMVGFGILMSIASHKKLMTT